MPKLQTTPVTLSVSIMGSASGRGRKSLLRTPNSVHLHMHKLLYGLIKEFVKIALGSTLEPVGFLSVQGAVPEEVKLPMFLDMGSLEKTPPPTVSLGKQS